ncbi:MAG: aldehyde dehydrogenase [Deltaproteobacteria bacterium]|nr:aldehyde dehydrogenase [Deltaproteobacteria bacterium]
MSRLRANKDSWVHLGMRERLSLLDEVHRDFISIGDRWVAAELEAKGLASHTLGEAEEWTILATIHRAIRTLRRSLSETESLGQPRVPGPITMRPDGQVVARTFPLTPWDRFLFLGVTGEVWMEPGLSADDTIATQAAAYKDTQRKGTVSLVLGAGNASMLPVCDTLHRLFVELQVVVLKPNPVNAHLGPLMEEGFRALIERGFLAIVYGGAEEGAYLSSHPQVEELHVTGSDKTFEAIVFGAGHEGRTRKAERRPLITKRFTGELGNVSPVIIVPGPWKSGDVPRSTRGCRWRTLGSSTHTICVLSGSPGPPRGISRSTSRSALLRERRRGSSALDPNSRRRSSSSRRGLLQAGGILCALRRDGAGCARRPDFPRSSGRARQSNLVGDSMCDDHRASQIVAGSGHRRSR